mmetsp:Transcript_59696/g.141248  ORF Transcript_59696/g.141248 Transcript_59696/m.141248 type:complete len:90 (+) Transcript_59696:3283-3552(+)
MGRPGLAIGGQLCSDGCSLLLVSPPLPHVAQDYAGGRRVNGYITQLDQPPGWVTVQWLRGGANNVYRMGAEGRYDLMPTGGTHTDPDGE